MHRKQRKLPWTLTWLVLGLAVSAWAQGAGVDEEAQLQPAAELPPQSKALEVSEVAVFIEAYVQTAVFS